MDIDRPPDIVVIASGAPVEAWRVASVSDSTRVIAADAGVTAALLLGWRVDVAVGDFDSLPPDDLARLDDIAGEVRRFPVDKDATDLELALCVAAESSPARVLVAGIEGGRPDHALANLLLAASDRFAALDVEIVVAQGRAWVVRDQLTGYLPEGSLVSVIPVHGAAQVSIAGVRWPLARRTLPAGTTLGVSNEVAGHPFSLDVHDGVAVCIAPRNREEHP